MDEKKLEKSSTTDGLTEGYENSSAPGPIKDNGQHSSYWILSEEERKKGFIRPVRTNYIHVGIRPKYSIRDLTDEENEKYSHFGYVKYEKNLDDESAIVGKFWTEKQLNSGCGVETTMNQSIAETYARDPKYYGSTFCINCGEHIRVEEFVWDGTNDKVGS